MPNEGWIQKQFDVVSDENNTRRIGLSISLPNNRWVASDPRGIIDPDDGNWQSNNVNTDCRANGRTIIMLVGCGIANVSVGQNGEAQIPQAASERFTWTCTRIVT